MYELKNLSLIIDLDGFNFNKTFHVRELGFFSLTKQTYGSFRFNLCPIIHEMSEADWRTAIHCKFHIHGLSVKPLPWEKDCYDEKSLDALVKDLYKKNETQSEYVIGYKGGILERNLLEKLCIPSLNLENFGCPKYDHLMEPKIEDCGYHLRFENVHCPMKECIAFGHWVAKKLRARGELRDELNQYFSMLFH